MIPSPWIRGGPCAGWLLRPLRGQVTGACDHRNGTSGGLQDRPSEQSPPLSAARATATLCRRRGVERRCGERAVVRQEKFHDCGDFIRPPATTDSCDTGEGD